MLRQLFVHRWQLEEFFQRRIRDAFDAAEGAQQGALAHTADAGNPVEGGIERLLGAQLAVMGDGEAMGFVANALQEK
ncbi:hypothetical protein D3C83_100550 [compost metagenome]